MHTGQFGEIDNNTQKTQHIQNAGKSTVLGAIRMASARTGVDFAYLVNKADQESGLNPSAKASSSSATGLFQFIKSTWLEMVKEHGDAYGLGKEANAIEMKNGKAVVTDPAVREKILNMRHDPVLNAAMAAEYTRENKDYLDAKIGGTVGSTELYLAHFLGAGGAEKFLKAMRASPNASAADVMPGAADANPGVFYSKSGHELSLKQIYNRFAAKFNKDIDTKGMTDEMAMADASAILPKRDLAVLSPSLYSAPMEAEATAPALSNPLIDRLKASGGLMADTLFNAMVLAQTGMNDALKATSKTRTL